MKIRTAGLLALTALAPTLSGCWAVAVGASSALITSEFADTSMVFLVEGHSAREVWSSARTTLSQMASEPITLDEDLRAARGRYDGNVVTIAVSTHAIDVVELRVQARKLGFVNGEITKLVGDRIVRDLGLRHRPAARQLDGSAALDAAARR